MIPNAPPVKNAMYKAKRIPGNPRIRPSKNDNLTSPNPIPRPLVSKNIPRKNKNAPIPERRLLIIGCIKAG